MSLDNDLFKGKRIIRYDPLVYNYSQILEALLEIEKKNVFSIHPEHEALDIKISEIKTVGLSSPVLLSDKRWETLHLTSSALFLGSALANRHFNVIVKQQILPVTTIDSQLLGCDLIGFTLFEDLFTQTQDLLIRLKSHYHYKGLIAAGGPLITLTPFKSTFHLPQINLLVRGEAEFVFPGLVEAINANNLNKLLTFNGFLFQIPGLIIISDFNQVNMPEHFNGFQFNLDFLQKNHLKAGLEVNLSRGCQRGCIFCSAVQGKKLRKLPEKNITHLLNQFLHKLDTFSILSPEARTININDDDILQDTTYAGSIFQLIKAYQFRLWGIQTAVDSFFDGSGEIQTGVLDLIDDKSLYVDDNPLVWIGTDAFLNQRGKRLGKRIPGKDQLTTLIEELENRKIRNYHYWISSDHLSNWEEFICEFIYIFNLQTQFKYFGLIAHSPFLVPYSTTPVYRYLNRSQEQQKRIKYKKILKSNHPFFTFPLVERVETVFPHLNRLLNNEKSIRGLGFFDCLRQKDYVNAFITLYNFLKQERIEVESFGDRALAEKLIKIETDVENQISKII